MCLGFFAIEGSELQAYSVLREWHVDAFLHRCNLCLTWFCGPVFVEQAVVASAEYEFVGKRVVNLKQRSP